MLNIPKLPFFRLIVSIGTISDMLYNPTINDYEPMVFNLHGASETFSGNWNFTQTILPEHVLSVKMDVKQVENLPTMLPYLQSMAVKFGNVGFTGEPVEILRKVLVVG